MDYHSYGTPKSGSIAYDYIASEDEVHYFKDYSDEEISTFMDGLERYKIENPFPQVSPTIQMSYAVISTMFMTYQLNRKNTNRDGWYLINREIRIEVDASN